MGSGKAVGLVLGKPPGCGGCVGGHDSQGRLREGCLLWGGDIAVYGLARGERGPSSHWVASRTGLWGGRGATAPLAPAERLRWRSASAGEGLLCVSPQSEWGEPRRAKSGRTEGWGRCPRGTDLACQVHTLLLRYCQVHSRVASCAGLALLLECWRFVAGPRFLVSNFSRNFSVY